ncbi:MAG: phosphoribosyltransferase [Acidobacteriota bacterium]|nr:MAG: phosphoribosyltransferase [Acidobacteriota bacterium]
MHHRFTNRREAGRSLAAKLEGFRNKSGAVVLALPRGGVPVAYEIAKALNLPLDVQVVRKLGVPGQRELAFGAIAPGGVAVYNERLLEQLNLGDEAIGRVRDEESAELARRESEYRRGREAPDLKGRTVILVDDGLATGATMRAAVESVRKKSPAGIIVAVPVAAPDICSAFDIQPDVTCVCLVMPEPLYGVGWWYEDFEQTTDEKVRELLDALQPAAANGKAA